VSAPLEPTTADIAIVGAGAAGLAAAIFARRLNPSSSVTLLDGASRPGAKILVSGGSRCNVTNAVVSERDFSGGKPSIIRRILKSLPINDTIAWFTSLGVPLHEEAHGKLFPDSNRSRDVLDALLREAAAAGVVLETSARVHDVISGPTFTLSTARGLLHAGAVVMATGGLSLPKTGSDGGGLEMARRLGHSIVATTPALVPLTSAEDLALHRALSGVSQDVEAALWVDGAIARRAYGSLLWTHFGVSGPVILDISRHWLRARLDQRDVHLTLNLVPGESFEAIDRQWTARAVQKPHATLQSALSDTLPASVATNLLGRLNLDPAATLAHLPRDTRRRLSRSLTQWPAHIVSSRGYNYAEATAGGVALEEIDPSTMESRRCKGLYLIGEMLDVDGRIGGFNFQWAWASARVCALALARS
jgi:predicted Rossmann fold flavoprotein